MTAPFQVYSASAGAGKTYKLVQRYLEKALGGPPGQFLSILAITFTKKAAKEMKDRVLGALYSLAYEAESPSLKDLRADLSAHLNMSQEELASQAEAVLGRILHQYSGFAISTIDSFTDRLIRSFSRELGLQANYQVELQSELILREAVDNLLESVVAGQDVEKVLQRYINEQLVMDKAARYGDELREGGSDLFAEDALRHLQLLEGMAATEFLKLHRELHSQQASFQSRIYAAAQELIKVFEEEGIRDADISGKKLLSKLRQVANPEQSQMDFPPSTLSPTDRSMLQGERKLYSNANKEAKAKIDPITGKLEEAMLAFLDEWQSCLEPLAVLKAVKENFFKTAVLSELSGQVQEIQDRTGRLPIGLFNKLISEALRDQPAPFLYERLGDRYRHFFIDEFQDTSLLQWRNLLPLLHESLAQGDGSVMLVGDAKQAIYRFRGGDVDQFVELYQDRDGSNRASPSGPELYGRESLTLNCNRRSRKEIVCFNNYFFPKIASSFTSSAYRELYEQGRQEPKRNSGGLVRIRWIDYVSGAKEAHEEEQFQELKKTIQQVRKRRYSLSDIAVLVGKGSEAKKCARFLMEQELPAVGPDNLSLQSSGTVLGLVGFLQTMLDARYQEARLPWAQWLYRCLEPAEDPTVFLRRLCRHTRRSTWKELEHYCPDWNTRQFLRLPLQEQLYYLLERLEPSFRSDSLVQAFLDEVFRMIQRDSAGLGEILDWWEATGQYQSLDLRQTQEAIQILTIHKSKGLQFPVVILAFAGDYGRATLDDSWKTLPEEPASLGLPAARISWKSSIADQVPNSWYDDQYQEQKEADLLDNRNKWYVAFTRAREELHVLAKRKNPPAKEAKPKEIGELLAKYCLEEDSTSLEWSSKGTPRGKEAAEESSGGLPGEELAGYRSGDWRQRIRVSDEAPEHWESGEVDSRLSTGKKLHYLLAEIEQADDVPVAVERALSRGDFQPEEGAYLRSLLSSVTEHPQLKTFFEGNRAVLTERPILLPAGGQRIPDRLILEDSKVHILDYKSGAPREAHRQQLDEYYQLLGQMGYDRGQRILVYLGPSIEVDSDW